MPEKEAKRYGDKAFTQMMYAKIVTVQLINRMGYDGKPMSYCSCYHFAQTLANNLF